MHRSRKGMYSNLTVNCWNRLVLNYYWKSSTFEIITPSGSNNVCLLANTHTISHQSNKFIHTDTLKEPNSDEIFFWILPRDFSKKNAQELYNSPVSVQCLETMKMLWVFNVESVVRTYFSNKHHILAIIV